MWGQWAQLGVSSGGGICLQVLATVFLCLSGKRNERSSQCQVGTLWSVGKKEMVWLVSGGWFLRGRGFQRTILSWTCSAQHSRCLLNHQVYAGLVAWPWENFWGLWAPSRGQQSKKSLLKFFKERTWVLSKKLRLYEYIILLFVN